MKFLPIILAGLCLTAAAIPAEAQRDANTSSARAAYSMPSSNYSTKKKNKSKKNKPKSARKAKKRDTDAARERRRSIGL
jgi:hypothetical protein